MREDPNYNQRQYERMLTRIDLNRSGQISVPKLIADIEALIWALESVPDEWRSTLLASWAALVHANANALYENGNAPNEQERRRISEALNGLERVIKNRGPEINSYVN